MIPRILLPESSTTFEKAERRTCMSHDVDVVVHVEEGTLSGPHHLQNPFDIFLLDQTSWQRERAIPRVNADRYIKPSHVQRKLFME